MFQCKQKTLSLCNLESVEGFSENNNARYSHVKETTKLNAFFFKIFVTLYLLLQTCISLLFFFNFLYVLRFLEFILC